MMIAYFNGPQDWLIIGLIVLVIFGGSKIPQLAKGLGEGLREFKRSILGQPSLDTWRADEGRAHDETGVNKRDAIIVVVLLLIIAMLGILLFIV